VIELARRNVIAGGLVGGLGLLAPGLARASGLQPLRAFFFDQRSAASSAAGEAHRAVGAAIFDGRREDLGQVWRRTMPLLLAGGGEVAGLTPWSDLLIAELSGRELGLRLEFHEPSDGALHRWTMGG
jgi:hypothetical protein